MSATKNLVDRTELESWIGREVGVSDWFQLTQERIDRFAELTLDRQFIHLDPERARQAGFGDTIAHGLLTLSMIPHFASSGGTLAIADVAMRINYGLNKVRFLRPVLSGRRIRGRFRLLGVQEKAPGRLVLRHEVTIDIEGEDRPALIAETLGLVVLRPESTAPQTPAEAPP
jgi:acyl dehydratase